MTVEDNERLMERNRELERELARIKELIEKEKS